MSILNPGILFRFFLNFEFMYKKGRVFHESYINNKLMLFHAYLNPLFTKNFKYNRKFFLLKFVLKSI